MSNLLSSYFKPFVWKDEQRLSCLSFFKNQNLLCSSEKLNTDPLMNLLKKQCPWPRFTQICGGPNVYIMYERRHELLKAIATDLTNNENGFFNQIAYDLPGEGFRLAMDVDSDRVLTQDEIIDMGVVLQDTLHQYYVTRAHPIAVFVSTCGPRMKKEKLCTSVHLISHLKVSLEEARQLTFSFRLLLKAKIKMDGLVVDSGIYNKPSSSVNVASCHLRLIYSQKKESCPSHQDDFCALCKQTRFVVPKSVYEPCLVMYDNGVQPDQDYFDKTHTNFFDVLRNHSIWPDVDDITTGFAKPSSFMSYEVEEEFEKNIHIVDKDTLINPFQEKKGKKRKLEDILKERITDENVLNRFQSFIRNIKYMGHKPFESIDVRYIDKPEEKVKCKKHVLYIKVSGIGAGYCLHNNSDHGDKRIYFIYKVEESKLQARCWSTKYEACIKQKETPIEFEVPQYVYPNPNSQQQQPNQSVSSYSTITTVSETSNPSSMSSSLIRAPSNRNVSKPIKYVPSNTSLQSFIQMVHSNPGHILLPR